MLISDVLSLPLSLSLWSLISVFAFLFSAFDWNWKRFSVGLINCFFSLSAVFFFYIKNHPPLILLNVSMWRKKNWNPLCLSSHCLFLFIYYHFFFNNNKLRIWNLRFPFFRFPKRAKLKNKKIKNKTKHSFIHVGMLFIVRVPSFRKAWGFKIFFFLFVYIFFSIFMKDFYVFVWVHLILVDVVLDISEGCVHCTKLNFQKVIKEMFSEKEKAKSFTRHPPHRHPRWCWRSAARTQPGRQRQRAWSRGSPSSSGTSWWGTWGSW